MRPLEARPKAHARRVSARPAASANSVSQGGGATAGFSASTAFAAGTSPATHASTCRPEKASCPRRSVTKTSRRNFLSPEGRRRVADYAGASISTSTAGGVPRAETASQAGDALGSLAATSP